MSCLFEITEGHVCDFESIGIRNFWHLMKYDQETRQQKVWKSVHVSGLKNNVVFLRVNIVDKKKDIIAVKQSN